MLVVHLLIFGVAGLFAPLSPMGHLGRSVEIGEGGKP